MNILVIFTGGTIGCKAKRGFLSTDESTRYALIDSYRGNEEVTFSTLSPYAVLSENLSSKELNVLQKEVVKNLQKSYDGIIVTHGTDTLLYSAAALEYAVGDCKIPVVLVSADYPLDDARSNGHINFEAAVAFIKSKKGNGVFVSYKNDDKDEADIHIATHILQHGECSANLYSITEKPYATYSNGEIIVGETLSEIKSAGLGVVEYNENSGVLVIESHPGDGFSYNLDGVKAIIFKPYHSATLSTACDPFCSFCKKAEKSNIPVFLVNAREGITYESTSVFSKLKINALPFGTYASAYMKIWAAISCEEEIEVFCKNEIAREVI